MKMWHGKRLIKHSIMDIFTYVQIKSNGIVSLLHIYLLIFGDSWTQI